MAEEGGSSWKQPRVWGMTFGLLAALAFGSYCVYAVWNGLFLSSGWPLLLRVPVGLVLGAFTFIGVSVATVALASFFGRRR